MSASITSPSASGRANRLPPAAPPTPELRAAIDLLRAAGYSVEPPAAHPDWGALPRLSAREQQVAALLVEGASNKVIARALDISVHTAKFHVTAILEKLGARNRADAVSIILREGLVAL